MSAIIRRAGFGVRSSTIRPFARGRVRPALRCFVPEGRLQQGKGQDVVLFVSKTRLKDRLKAKVNGAETSGVSCTHGT